MLFIGLDAEFRVLKLLFKDFLLKIIREAGNCENLILRVKSLFGSHGHHPVNYTENLFYLAT